MESKILNIKKLFLDRKNKVRKSVLFLKNKYNIKLKIGIVFVENSESCEVYVRSKIKTCEELYIGYELIKLPKDIHKEELIKEIIKLNNNESIQGYIVQLPLPKNIKQEEIFSYIDPKKDIDALSPVNIGKLFLGEYLLQPCTAKGIMSIFKYININIEGKNIGIIGRSNIVGKPCMLTSLYNNATVTICHSKTNNIEKITRNMDILIVCVGVPKLIKRNYIKKGSIIIDVGINRVKNTKKLVGDVDLYNVLEDVSYITPVPGGVGLMTVISLFENLLITTFNNNNMDIPKELI